MCCTFLWLIMWSMTTYSAVGLWASQVRIPTRGFFQTFLCINFRLGVNCPQKALKFHLDPWLRRCPGCCRSPGSSLLDHRWPESEISLLISLSQDRHNTPTHDSRASTHGSRGAEGVTPPRKHIQPPTLPQCFPPKAPSVCLRCSVTPS